MVNNNTDFIDFASMRSIWLLSLAKMVLVGWFLLSVFAIGQARAETPATTCSGKNLLEKIKAENAEEFQKIIEKAAQTPNGESVFWKIEKDGMPASWLLGTMHVSDPAVVKLRPQAQAGFDSADTLIIETTEMLDPDKAQAEMMRLSNLTLLTDGSTLDGKISDDLVDKLEKATAERGLPFFAAKRMQPWFVTAAIALPVCEVTRKAGGADVLDTALAKDAGKQGKSVVGLETIEEQLTAISSTPIEFQIQGLEDTLRLGNDVGNDLIYTMIQLYFNNKAAMIMPMTEAVARQLGSEVNEEHSHDFEKKLIVERNHLMAKRAKQYLDKGNVFMAVGALHLPGKEGVVELLKGEGYILTPVIETPAEAHN